MPSRKTSVNLPVETRSNENETDDSFEFSSSHFSRIPMDTRAYLKSKDNGGAAPAESIFQKSAEFSSSPNLQQYEESLLSKTLKTSRKSSTISRQNEPKFSPFYKSSAGSNSNVLLATSPKMKSQSARVFIDAENPDPSTVDIISRHLVGEEEAVGSAEMEYFDSESASVQGNEEFDSLQLQGGDITREIYNWKKEHSHRTPRKVKSFGSISRTASFSSFGNGAGAHAGGNGSSTNLHGLSEPDLNVSEILLPGGFRRSFIAQRKSQINGPNARKPAFFTSNFIEFLTLYGHFAGEELSDEEDDDDEEDDEEMYLDSRGMRANFAVGNNERVPLIRKMSKSSDNSISTTKSVLLLLKAFIGTGILFLPKGFCNGGMLFSVCALVFFSVLSFWCFLTLIDTKIKSQVSSFGDIGYFYFGKKMRLAILTSIVLSQIGFASAYIVFVAQNLQSFFKAIAAHKDHSEIATKSDVVSIPFLIFVQLLIFVPLSLTRKIAKLSGTALVADFFILLGIIYIYYNSTWEILVHSIKPVQAFNPDNWTIFIGTAVFTYEGIGLLIPIQESMQKPEKFTSCLGGVMVGITFAFISIGSICYLAYGSDVQTVILNNFPQDSVSVNMVQLLYSLAILLSTPLQLFPAIRILEHGIFGSQKSGKFNLKVKWKKNLFRVALVIVTSMISWAGNSDLDKFVAIIGSFACIPLIYIYPPMLHLKSKFESSGASGTPMLNTPFAMVLNGVIVVFGVFLMLYTSFDTLRGWIF